MVARARKVVDTKPTGLNDGGPHIKQHPHQHPLHKIDGNKPDHRDMKMSEKYNQVGPHIEMPDHQHPLHHPHTDVSEKHHSAQKKGHY